MQHKQVVELIKDIMRVFDEHEIEKKTDLMWICKKPGSSSYWFGVSLGPGLVCLWGDTDELLLRPHEHHTYGWATDIRPESYDYVLSKSCPNQELKRFDPDDARAWLKELEDRAKEYLEDGEEAGAAAELTYVKAVRDDWDGETEHSWHAAQYENGCDESISCRSFTRGTLTAYAALCWWASQMREEA